ncbi:anti-sigma factor family protein [Robertmurraya massiliosenegalensis]|uniref:anti-sigma factor family protein n=1 Tax=Robertmurraya massiliosenegalensis TaxID=1287657 RepID=UPI000360DB81|nr:zf-HC2 domain-containing protein [Robertmurraya massiliosenegalensis]
MKCNLVRDLLPLYVEGDCSPVTNKLVKNHLQSCKECRELYDLMKTPIEIDPAVPDDESEVVVDNQRKLWKKYYGRLIMKGSLLFVGVYALVLTLIELLK